MSTPRIANHPFGIAVTRKPTSLFKVVQMSDRFAHREHGLVCIERPIEKYIEQPGCALWRLFTAIFQSLQALFVMRVQSLHPLLHPGEGQPV